jgi:hypothetical protein
MEEMLAQQTGLPIVQQSGSFQGDGFGESLAIWFHGIRR